MTNTKYEVSIKTGRSPHVFVFTNAPISEWEKAKALSLDRWWIINGLDDSNSLVDYFPVHRFPQVANLLKIAKLDAKSPRNVSEEVPARDGQFAIKDWNINGEQQKTKNHRTPITKHFCFLGQQTELFKKAKTELKLHAIFIIQITQN